MYLCRCGSRCHVVDSRQTLFQSVPAVRRRRQCTACGLRVSTIEHASAESDERVRAVRHAIAGVQRALDELRGVVA